MKYLHIIVFMFLPYLVNNNLAQQQQVIATAGGNGQNGDIAIEWTLGEPVITTLVVGTTTLTQGFHQPQIVVEPVRTIEGLSFTIEAYPNPTEDLLMIQLGNTAFENIQYVLFDFEGKVVEQKYFTSNIVAVKMSSYASGLYILRIMQPDQEIKTFKIIKH